MKFSIVVPTYNEENDIRETIESLIRLDYPEKEILIVDDSTDGTPEIVNEYSDRGVVLIHPGGGGRCEARNLGVMSSQGEIVCILNADVRPRQDFLERLKAHYENGADYVLVKSRISNTEDLFARYVECMDDSVFSGEFNPDTMDWTEGFSCRKNVAIAAGLFPVGFLLPICAGEDGYFGIGLRKQGAKKVFDFSIVVDHVAPATLNEYWRIRKGRGEGAAQMHRFIDGWPHSKLVVWNLLKIMKSAIIVGTILPLLATCARAARHSPRGMRDLLPFCYAWLVERVAFHVGEWQMASRIREKEMGIVAGRR